jgi:PEP-CTERM motif
MKNIFRALLILGVLLFVNTPSVLADMATFSATSRVDLRSPVPLPSGLILEIVEFGTLPSEALETTHFGSGHLISKLPVIDFPLAFSVGLQFQNISGEAGPGFGAEGISQFASSKALKFTNTTDNRIVITLTYTFGTELITTASGGGQANAQFEFRFLDQGFRTFGEPQLFSVHSPGANSSISFDNGKAEFLFAIPPHTFESIHISGSQTGLAAVPEPTTMLLLGTGLAGVAIRTRKRFKSRQS